MYRCLWHNFSTDTGMDQYYSVHSFKKWAPIITKYAWIREITDANQHGFACRLVAMAAIYTVSHASLLGSFVILDQRPFMPGLTLCWRLIWRNLARHARFLALLFKRLQWKPSARTASSIIIESVGAERVILHGTSLPVICLNIL